MLFFTLEAFCRRSIDERLVGDGDPPRPVPYRSFSALEFVLAWRFIQNSRGEVVFSTGDDWNGDESVLRPIFYANAC